MRWVFIIAVLVVAVVSVSALADITGSARVIDGDTIEVQGQRIRLHGIDAPEGRQLCFNDGEPWLCGTDATNALRQKIGDRPVTCEELDRDRYERIVAKCMVEEQFGRFAPLARIDDHQRDTAGPGQAPGLAGDGGSFQQTHMGEGVQGIIHLHQLPGPLIDLVLEALGQLADGWREQDAGCAVVSP